MTAEPQPDPAVVVSAPEVAALDVEGAALDTPTDALNTDFDAVSPVPSPALNLQQHLDRRLEASSYWRRAGRAWFGDQRWSTRRSLAFILVSNSIAWALIVWAAITFF